MLDGVEAGTCGKHPAGENPPDLVLQRDFINLDKTGCLRRFCRRPGVAHTRRDLKRAELHRLVDRHVEGDDPSGDLVEAGKDGDRIAYRRGRRHCGQHHTGP